MAQRIAELTNKRVQIARLWECRDEAQWRLALDHYWTNPTVQRVLKVEECMESLELEQVKHYGPTEWLGFLEKYFEWKFTGNYLPQKLDYLRETGVQQLFSVKETLFAFDEFDLHDTRKCLNTVRSPNIKGLQFAGASGLLAVLFPQYFGTADKFVVEALRQIDSLPEKQRVAEMNPNSLTERDAVLLIDIMRRKAKQLNGWFATDFWTPRKVDKILWDLRGGKHCS